MDRFQNGLLLGWLHRSRSAAKNTLILPQDSQLMLEVLDLLFSFFGFLLVLDCLETLLVGKLPGLFCVLFGLLFGQFNFLISES